MSDDRSRIGTLDGLRTFAILPVLAGHLWAYPLSLGQFNMFPQAGWLGVRLFFVLSGFLITGILWQTRHSADFYRTFYIRRALRIMPPYYLVMLVVFVLHPMVSQDPELMAARERWPYYVFYLANWPGLAGGGLMQLTILWSLAVEEQFYLVWPGIIRRLSLRRAVSICLMVVIAWPVIRAFTLGTVFRMVAGWDGFAVGALLALIWHERLIAMETVRRWANRTLWLLGPLLVALIVTGKFDHESDLVNTIGLTFVVLASGALVVVALTPGRTAQFILNARPMRYIGRISYGIYLYHPFARIVVSGAGMEAVPTDSVGWALVVFAVTFAVTMLMAALSYRFFETPILNYAKRFRYSTRDERAPVPALAVPEPTLSVR